MTDDEDIRYRDTVRKPSHASGPGACPYCPAVYSTEEEMKRHLGQVTYHLSERLDETKAALNECARQRGELHLLFDAAVCFKFGDWYVEHIVDTDNKDWGWVVSKDGKWAQEGMTRDAAIAEARRRSAPTPRVIDPGVAKAMAGGDRDYSGDPPTGG